MVVTPLKPSSFKADIPTQRDPLEDVSKLKPNPLTLVVSITQDLQLKLNQEPMGSVNDTGALAAKLQQTFSQRREQHAYKVGMETATNIPEDQRIEKTVFVKAPRALHYGDVVKVIDAIKGAGASPVGLQVDDLP
jgi:biopolymer transport protein ExbD